MSLLNANIERRKYEVDMAKEVILPKFGNSVEECLIKHWNKSVGDSVQEGDTLCEVETDKTTMDVLSTETGKILHVFYKEDDVVDILHPLVIVGEEGENIDDLIELLSPQSRIPQDAHVSVGRDDEAINSIGEIVSEKTNSSLVISDVAKVENVIIENRKISPRARTFLQNLGLTYEQFVAHFQVEAFFGSKSFLEEKDLVEYFNTFIISPAAITLLIQESRILTITTGSGIGGRIVEEDIKKQPKKGEITSKTNTKVQSDFLKTMQNVEEYERIPVTSMRKIISEKMMESLQSTAQLTLTMQTSAAQLKALRMQFKLEKKPITINDMIMYAVSRVLQENLWANSIMVDNSIISYRDINLGCAVQSPRGLMVMVVDNAGEKTIDEISINIRSLAQACWDGTITPEKLQGGTFTVTNLGVFGVQTFTPILNAPQTGILGVGGIDVRVVEKSDGEYGFEPCITLSLTFDHRAYDGVDGAALLQKIAEKIATLEIH